MAEKKIKVNAGNWYCTYNLQDMKAKVLKESPNGCNVYYDDVILGFEENSTENGLKAVLGALGVDYSEMEETNE